MRYPDILVLRHGETEWNREARMQGRLDSPLTREGLAQADRLGRFLRESGRLNGRGAYTSPQGRARRTAEIVIGDIGTDLVEDARLVEIGLGDWEGLTLGEIERAAPHHFGPDADPFFWRFDAPGGERLDPMLARCRAFLDALDGPALVVTHGITSRLLRGLWLGLTEPDIAALPGGQGCVYELSQGEMIRHAPD